MARPPSLRLATTTALLSTAGLCIPFAGMAQEATVLAPIIVEAEDAYGPNDTFVAQRTATGTKTDTPILDVPAQVSVVTEEELEARDADTLEQALSYTASVSVDEYGGDNRYDFFRIRGFLSNGLGTYRDGLAVRNLNFSTARMEPYGLQRLDILKGSTSTLFGLNGPGGMVNAVTKRPQDLAFGEVYTTLGEDHTEIGTDFGAPLTPDGDWTYRVTAKLQDAETSDYLTDDRVYFAPALTWKPTDRTTLTFLVNYTKKEGNSGNSTPLGLGIDPDVFFGEPDFNALDTTEKNYGYSFEHEFGNGLTFRQNLRYSTLDFLLEQVYDATLDPAVDRVAYAIDGDVDRFAVDNQLQYDATFGRVQSRTLVGIDHTHDELSELYFSGSAPGLDPADPVYCGRSCVTLGTPSLTKIDQKVTGIYAQEELTFDDRWILTLGGRYDHVDTTRNGDQTTTDEAFTSRIGLTYKITPDVSIYANYSESFQPLGSATSTKPQTGDQYEVGVKYRPAGTNAMFTAALFDLTQNDVSTNIGNFVYRQVGEINVKGIELEAKVAVNDQFNLTAAYSYWDAEIVKDGVPANNGNTPLLTPDHLASIWADYTIEGAAGRGDMNLGLGVRYVGERYNDLENTLPLGGYAVVDAAFGYELAQNTSLRVNVKNLFDREYLSSYNFTGTNGFYGDRRSVHATVKYAW